MSGAEEPSSVVSERLAISAKPDATSRDDAEQRKPNEAGFVHGAQRREKRKRDPKRCEKISEPFRRR